MWEWRTDYGPLWSSTMHGCEALTYNQTTRTMGRRTTKKNMSMGILAAHAMLSLASLATTSAACNIHRYQVTMRFPLDMQEGAG